MALVHSSEEEVQWQINALRGQVVAVLNAQAAERKSDDERWELWRRYTNLQITDLEIMEIFIVFD